MSDTENTPVETEPSVELPAESNGPYSGKTFEYVAGRRYNSEEDVDYVLPNDDEESDRLKSQHEVFKYAFQCNYHTPLKKQLEEGIYVIDAGCGPAAWTLDMAEAYPNSKFTGLDVSFVFPENDKPDNVEFQIQNIGQELSLPENSYDYYFQRLLVLGLTGEAWDVSLSNAYKLLKPEGYIELVEPNVYELYHCGPILEQLMKPGKEIISKKGLVPTIAFELEDRLKKAGFVNIKTLEIPIPLNHSGKVGQLLWTDYERILINTRPIAIMSNPAFKDMDVYMELVNAIAEECVTYKTTCVVHIAYGQKPSPESLG